MYLSPDSPHHSKESGQELINPFQNGKNTGMAELVTYLPISSPFIRFAGRFVDEAFGVATGYNFFVFEAALATFEIVACNLIINYWSTTVPVGAIIAIVIALYG